MADTPEVFFTQLGLLSCPHAQTRAVKERLHDIPARELGQWLQHPMMRAWILSHGEFVARMYDGPMRYPYA